MALSEIFISAEKKLMNNELTKDEIKLVEDARKLIKFKKIKFIIRTDLKILDDYLHDNTLDNTHIVYSSGFAVLPSEKNNRYYLRYAKKNSKIMIIFESKTFSKLIIANA